MSITVYPYKLTQRELEARLAPGLTVLPGQLLRFEGKSPVYGKIQEVRALPALAAGMPEGVGVLIELLYGTPSLEPQAMVLLNEAQMAREVQALLGPLKYPLRFTPDFSADLNALGAFTLVEGDDFLLKFDALNMLVGAIKPYHRVLIIDPLGIFEEGEGYAYRKAGRDVRLSVQQVGTRQFLEAFGEMFSPELREVALRAVADHLPAAASGFVGFSHWLNLEIAVNVPLKNLIVQNYHSVMQSQVFADTPQQALTLEAVGQALGASVCVLDVSELADPWKGLFYREVCRMAFGPETDGLVPVLLYPEKYLRDLLSWVQRADEAGVNLLILGSAFAKTTVREQANNRIWVESADQLIMQGSLTLGLPVSLPLLAGQPMENASLPPENSQPVEPMTETQYEPYFPPSPSTTLLNHQPSELLNPQETLWGEPERQWGESKPEPDIDTPASPQAWIASEPVNDSEQKLSFEAHPDYSATQAMPPAASLPIASPEAIGPIVDLAAPPPEATISFLSAEQLSELLASSPKPDAEPDESDEDLAPSVPGMLPMPASGAQMPRQLPPVGAPVVFEELLSDEPESESGEEFFPYSSFQIDLDDAAPPEPVADIPAQEITPPKSEEFAAHPPFPTPEEYEREEFSFDLEPKPPAELGLATHETTSSPSGDGMTDTVSRSLIEFERDLPMDEPLFDMTPESPAPVEVPTEEPGASMEAEPPAETIADSSEMADAEMQEALDLMFPIQPDEEATPASQKPEMPTAEPEELVPIVQKQDARPSTPQEGFQVGGRVRHATYGEGVIQKVIPMEGTVILNIQFESVGKRLLDPALCELQHV